jgi:hypothetical protein
MGWKRGLAAAFLVGTSLLVHATSEAKTGASYLDLNLKQNRYLGGVQHSAQTSNYTLLAADLNIEGENKNVKGKFNPVGQGAFEFKDEFYFGVPEIYVQARSFPAWFNLTIGRQKRSWSHLDEEFNLGIWQPQLRWDYLNPVQQGLTAVFMDWNLGSGVKLTLFTSPIHLPDQGPQFNLNQGKFESSNRWFVQPQSQIQLFSGTRFSDDVPLYFELDKPAEEEMIMHSSFGFAFNYQGDQSPFWTQVAYAYKPRNQIHLGIECTNCVNIGADPAPVEITALIHTKIINHHVLTWETGFNRIDDQGWISMTGDFPNSSGMPEGYEEAPLNSSFVLGAGYKHYIRDWVKLPSWLQYSYMRLWEFKREQKAGLVPDDQVQSSLDRYPYREVAAVDWSMQLNKSRRNRFSLRNRYSYSVSESGGWLSSGVAWEMGDATWTLGMDVLGADVDAGSKDAGLFSRYRSNDRVYGGLNYVF